LPSSWPTLTQLRRMPSRPCPTGSWFLRPRNWWRTRTRSREPRGEPRRVPRCWASTRRLPPRRAWWCLPEPERPLRLPARLPKPVSAPTPDGYRRASVYFEAPSAAGDGRTGEGDKHFIRAGTVVPVVLKTPIDLRGGSVTVLAESAADSALPKGSRFVGA